MRPTSSILSTMRILTKQDVMKLFNMKLAVEYTERAFSLYSAGEAESPVRTSIATPSGSNLFMPAATKDACGCKVVTTRLGNAAKNLPTVPAVYVDIDEETGVIKTLLDGQALTYFRTGAASGVAAKYLSRNDAKTLIIIGTGVQGTSGCEAVLSVRNISKVLGFDGYEPSLKKFAALMAEKGIQCETHSIKEINQYIGHGDIIITTTTSATPLFDSALLKQGAFVSCVGAYQPNTREVDTKLITTARVFVDTRAGCFAEAGDLLIPVKEGKFSLDKVCGEIGDVVNKKIQGRANDTEICVFKTTGSSVQDCVVGHRISQLAEEMNIGQTIDM